MLDKAYFNNLHLRNNYFCNAGIIPGMKLLKKQGSKWESQGGLHIM